MKQPYKLKPAVISFIISKKRESPEVGCRAIAHMASERFHRKISKSSVNSVLRSEHLSGSVGRPIKGKTITESEIDRAGFHFLLVVDSYIRLSAIFAQTVLHLAPSAFRISMRDVFSVIQALLIHKCIFDVSYDSTDVYRNSEIWALVGKRPSHTIYNTVIDMLKSSQLIVHELFRELSNRLRIVANCKFILRDKSSFLLDGQSNSIWTDEKSMGRIITTYDIADSYVEGFLRRERSVSVLLAPTVNLVSTEILNFILGFDNSSSVKKIAQVAFLDANNSVLEERNVSLFEKVHFFLGLFPWQMFDLADFDKKLPFEKIFWPDLNRELYYQIESFRIPQSVAAQEVMLNAIILKTGIRQPAHRIIITNYPRENLTKSLLEKELEKWIDADLRYTDLVKLSKMRIEQNSFAVTEFLEKIAIPGANLDVIFQALRDVVYWFFRALFLPPECRNWTDLKIKDIFLRQHGEIHRTQHESVHKVFNSNRLCNKSDLDYICRQINGFSIRDNFGAHLRFIAHE